MRKIYASFFMAALALHSSINARPVPAEELAQVNNFLTVISYRLTGQEILGGFISAEENDQGAITALVFELVFGSQEPKSRAQFSIDAAEDVKIKFAGMAYHELNLGNLLKGIGEFLPELHRQVESYGIYQASSQACLDNAITGRCNFKISPISVEAKSIKEFSASASFDLALNRNEVDLAATFNVRGELVRAAQSALTQAFNSLRQGQIPSENVLEELLKIASEIAEAIGKPLPKV